MASTETALVHRGDQALMRMDPSELIAKALDTGAGIETMERLVALAKDMRKEMARDAWHEAMAHFQAQCPTIRKTRKASIQTSRSSYTYTYAPLDEILGVVQPVMGPLGLSISWRQRMEKGQVVVNCRVSHTLGHHEESGDIAMPIITADPDRGANPAQRVGIATTYAKRYSLLGIIGMAPEDDPDAKGQDQPQPTEGQSAQGGPHHQGGAPGAITENQVKRLFAIVRGVGWKDEEIKRYLAEKESIEGGDATKIPKARYEEIVERMRAGGGAPA